MFSFPTKSETKPSFSLQRVEPTLNSELNTVSNLVNILRDEILNYNSESDPRYFKQLLQIDQTNIFLFGQPGVGKSKLTNSIFKSLHNVFDKETVAISGGSTNSHVTIDLKYIPLSSPFLSGGRPSNIRIIDAWGNDGTNYNPTLFENILKGKISNNSKQDNITINEIDKNKQVHAIVFVMTASSCSSEQDCKMIAQYNKIAMQNNLYPILYFSNYKKLIDTDPLVKKAISNVCQFTGIEIDSVFCTRNLAVDIQKERNDFIVKKNLEILQSCLNAADRYFEYKATFESNDNTANNNTLHLKAKYIGDDLFNEK